MVTILVGIGVVIVCGLLFYVASSNSFLKDVGGNNNSGAETGKGGEEHAKGMDESIDDTIRGLDLPSQKAKQVARVVSQYVDQESGRRFKKIREETQKLIREKDGQVKRANEQYQQAEQKYEKTYKEKKQTEAIVQAVGEGMIVVNKQGQPLLMNPAAEKLLGVKQGEMGDKSILDNQTDERVVSLLGDMKGTGEKEIQVSGSSETRKVLRASQAVIKNEDGETMGMVSMLTDVTKQRELEAMKEEFLANVTHELRTPLQCINESISLISEGVGGSVTDKQQHLLTVAGRNLKKLSRLINDLLDLSKLETGDFNLKMKTFPVSELVEHTKHTFDSWAHTKKLKLETKFPQGVEIEGDFDRLGQVLTNLVGNAMKFTPAGGTITIEAHQLKTSGAVSKQMKFCVRDTGPGISKQEQVKIFEKFQQAKSAHKSQYAGTGLGLTIAKDIVELHGGEISVESVENKGSCFLFAIPTKQPRHASDDVDEVSVPQTEDEKKSA
jgi:two-component system, OmpR family, sensor histidine kinase VicK